MFRRALLLSLVLPALACGGAPDDQEEASSSDALVAEGTPAAFGVLAFLNGPTATAPLLTAQVGLTRTAANNIVARVRARPLASIAQLDQVPSIGPSSIEKIRAYATRSGFVPAHLVKGVPLDDAQAQAMLAFAGSATADQIATAGLTRRTARAIVAARPILSVEALGRIAGVGKVSIEHLRDAHPAVCTLALTPRADADADVYSSILEAGTTLDTPWADLLGFEMPLCADWTTDTGRTAIGELLEQTGALQWGGPENPRSWQGVQVATDRFENLLLEARGVIDERGGGADAVRGRYPEIDALQARLLSAVKANPIAYFEITLSTDAEECSEVAVALADPRTGWLLILHRFPRC